MEFDWRIFPKTNHTADPQEINTLRRELNCETRTIPKKSETHVDVQRHRLVKSAQRTHLFGKFKHCCCAEKFVSGHWSFLGPCSMTK